MKRVGFFIAFQGFRDEEYAEPKRILEKAGIKVDTISTSKGMAKGKIKIMAEVDKTIEEVDLSQYSCLALVGGPGALKDLDKPDVHKLFTDFYKSGKPIAAICISPVILAHAGLLKGKKTTVYPDGVKELEKAGAIYTGEGCEKDSNIITANGPASAKAYGDAIVEAIN